MMLVLSFVLGHLLRRHKFYFVPEASASLLIGSFLNYSPFYHNLFINLGFHLLLLLLSLILFIFLGLIVGGLANVSNTEASIRYAFLISLCFVY